MSAAVLPKALEAIAGDRRLASPAADDGHLLAVRRMAADVAHDLAAGRLRHAPNKGGISAIDAALSKIARQRLMRRLGLGDDDQPACVLVEPVHDARPAHPADPGEAGAAMRNQRIDEGAVRMSRRRVDDEPGRLVDDDQMCILVANSRGRSAGGPVPPLLVQAAIRQNSGRTEPGARGRAAPPRHKRHDPIRSDV